MSEGVFKWLWMIAVTALIWGMVSMAINLDQADSIRDLQRRVGQLEQVQR